MRVAIIGAGASGMVAALTAARLGHEVTIFERQSRVGRKLLATGNGRCNLSNMNATPEHYHGTDVGFMRYAMEALPPEKALSYFASLGLLTVAEEGGRVYPMSNSANSVVDCLRYALESAKVKCVSGTRVTEIRHGEDFTVVTDALERFSFDAVIVACGGAAGEKLGGVKDGYGLLAQLGHTRTALIPSLVQIKTEREYPRSLKGIKAECALTLMSGETLLAEAKGELLFTETGVSGPAAFDISRAVAANEGREMALTLDLLPALSLRDTLVYIERRRENSPELTASELFTGALHNRLGRMCVKYAGIDLNKPMREITDAEMARAASSVHAFTLEVQGTEGFGSAQVTAGGVRTGEFNPETLESKLVPGLYACGEVLDIDGDCGGYNLQWAWASGTLAGRLGS